MIHQDRSEEVFALLASLLDELAPAAPYRAIFDRAVGKIRAIAEREAMFLPVDLPMAVGDVLGAPDDVRLVAATSSMLLWAGADLMDDAADGQLGEDWSDVPASVLALVSTNLLSTLPHLVAGRLEPGDDAAIAAFSHAVSRTLFAMSDGQAADLGPAASVRTADDYLALIRRKSGAEFALFASTPALLMGACDEAVAGWVRFGFAYGTMIQAFSDLFSSIAETPRSDLLLGKRSLPVVLTLESLSDKAHTKFETDLDLASHGDQAAAARAVTCMTEAGAIRASIERCELLRFRAARAVPVGLADLPRDHPIRSLMQAYNLF